MVDRKNWVKLNKKELQIGDRIQLIVDPNEKNLHTIRRKGATGTIIGRDPRYLYDGYLIAVPDKKEWENPGSTQDRRNWCIDPQQPITGARFEKIEELTIEEMLTSSHESLRKEGLFRKRQRDKLYNRFLTKLNFLGEFMQQIFQRKISS